MIKMKTKKCTNCGIEKPISAFYKHRYSKDGHAWQCKECNAKRGEIYRQTAKGVLVNLRSVNKCKHRREVNLDEEWFVNWYNTQPRVCVYCSIPEEHVLLLPEHNIMRRPRLAIDCKDNDLGYVAGNIVLACGRCNFLKSNVFTYDEFKDIGARYVKPKWMKLVKDKKGEEVKE